MAAAPLTLDSPALTAINARGGITREQRRRIARDFYRENWKRPVASLGIIFASLVMLRILLPIFGSLLMGIFTNDDRGLTPVKFPNFTVALPLWTLLKLTLLLLTLGYAVAFAVQVGRIVAFLHQRHALLYGRVASVVGEVRLCDGQPLAIFADRQVRPWDAGAMAGLAAGHYRFFLLPRPDWLLSVQRLSDWDRPTAEEAALAARYSLSAVNGFSPAHLPENRRGLLTPEQARSLRTTAPDTGWRVFVLFGISIAIGVAGAAMTARDALIKGFTQDRLGTVAACLAWAAIWLSILLKQFRDNARQKSDAESGRVVIYEGAVTKWEGWKYHSPDGSNTWVYRYEFPGGQFEVSQEAFRALADGLAHRVYSTELSKQLVNIELLPAPAPPVAQTPDNYAWGRVPQWPNTR